MPNAHLEDGLLKTANIEKTTPATILVTMQCLPDDDHVPDTPPNEDDVMSQKLHQMKMPMSHMRKNRAFRRSMQMIYRMEWHEIHDGMLKFKIHPLWQLSVCGSSI